MGKVRFIFIFLLAIAVSRGASASLIQLNFTVKDFIPIALYSDGIEYTSYKPAPASEVKGQFVWEGTSIFDGANNLVSVKLRIGDYEVSFDEVFYEVGLPFYGPTHSLDGNFSGGSSRTNDFQLEYLISTLEPIAFIYFIEGYEYDDINFPVGYVGRNFTEFDIRLIEHDSAPPTGVTAPAVFSLFGATLLGFGLIKRRRII